jgi:hypothetical protein
MTSYLTVRTGSGSLVVRVDAGSLIHASDLTYLGGFRLPGGTQGTSNFNSNGQGLAIGPGSDSLFLTGHLTDNAIAEVAIPASIVDSATLGDLATASVLQPLVSVLPRIPDTSNLDGKSTLLLGGLQVYGTQLIGTQYLYYDNSGTTVQSHFRFNTLDLATAPVEGMFVVGGNGLDGGFYDGYMCPIPAEWQAALGATHLTGNAMLSIVDRTSYGPAAFGFNPADLSISATAAAVPYVYYTGAHPLADRAVHNPVLDANTLINAVAFIPGTRSVLFAGSVGTNAVEYGDPEEFNDIYRGGKGWHSLNGDYAYQMWAYDVLDFIAVKGGAMQPWDVRPYAYWTFDFPQFEGAKYIGGMTFDPASGRLYVLQIGADNVATFSTLPIIQVYQVP